MFIKALQREGVSIVSPGVARLDASHATDLRDSLIQAVSLGQGELILDLEGVTLIDSTILGVVVGVFRDLPEDGRLVLCTVEKNVGSLLHLTNLDRFLSIYPSREEALLALR